MKCGVTGWGVFVSLENYDSKLKFTRVHEYDDKVDGIFHQKETEQNFNRNGFIICLLELVK